MIKIGNFNSKIATYLVNNISCIITAVYTATQINNFKNHILIGVILLFEKSFENYWCLVQQNFSVKRLKHRLVTNQNQMICPNKVRLTLLVIAAVNKSGLLSKMAFIELKKKQHRFRSYFGSAISGKGSPQSVANNSNRGCLRYSRMQVATNS
jgi:hypothetical protein